MKAWHRGSARERALYLLRSPVPGAARESRKHPSARAPDQRRFPPCTSHRPAPEGKRQEDCHCPCGAQGLICLLQQRHHRPLHGHHRPQAQSCHQFQERRDFGSTEEAVRIKRDFNEPSIIPGSLGTPNKKGGRKS